MPFPIDIKYIKEAENSLSLLFPESFIDKMTTENGGFIETDEDNWQLHPFFDKSDKKRISRTCNHIVLETKKAKEWNGFPENAVQIGENACGDKLIFLPEENGQKLKEAIFIFRHEEREITQIATSIYNLIDLANKND